MERVHMRKLILAAAAVLLTGISGTHMSRAADVGDSTSNISGSFQHSRPVAPRSNVDVREAQLELRHSGLYNGSVDGMIGPQTKQALVQFQKENGLEPTASLDANTMVAMFGNIGPSQDSSMPPHADHGSGQ
jgi:hypothetical protein